MNRVILMGRLVRDPEIKVFGDKTRARFTLAIDRPGKNPDGKRDTDFIPCSAWGKTAELLGNYFQKGDRTLIEGRLRVNPYTDKEGKKRSMTEVIADRVEFIVNHKKSTEKGNPEELGGFESMGQDVTSQFDEEIPF